MCLELDGKPRSYWSRFFPAGPEAHPNCRCWIEYAAELADEYDRAVEAIYAEYMALKPEPGPGMAYVMELVARKRALLRRIKGE